MCSLVKFIFAILIPKHNIYIEDDRFLLISIQVLPRCVPSRYIQRRWVPQTTTDKKKRVFVSKLLYVLPGSSRSYIQNGCPCSTMFAERFTSLLSQSHPTKSVTCLSKLQNSKTCSQSIHDHVNNHPQTAHLFPVKSWIRVLLGPKSLKPDLLIFSQ